MAPTQNCGQRPKNPPAWRARAARQSGRGEPRSPDGPKRTNVPRPLTAREALAVARVEARIADAVEHAPPLPADLSIRLIELDPRLLGRCVT